MEEKEVRMKVGLLIAAFIGVFVVSIISLIIIWTPKKQVVTDENTKKINTYKTYVGSKSIYFERYAKKINGLIKDEKYDELYKIILPEFKSYNNVKVADIEEYFKVRKLSGVALKVVGVKIGEVNGKNVAKIDVSSEDRSYEAGYMIYETSPNHYTFGIDDYVYTTTKSREIIRNDIQLTIKNMVYGLNDIEMEISIKNLNKKPITINTEILEEPIFSRFKTSVNQSAPSTVTFFNGRRIVVNPNEEISGRLKYDVKTLSHSAFKGLTMKNVVIGDSRTPIDIIYDL